jgi:hypothetical protein
MARFSVEANRTADSTLAVGGLLQDGTTQRRGQVYDFVIGSEATPADNPFLWVVDRGTTGLGTSSAVTPQGLDPGDPAGLLDAGENYTVNPTLGVRLMSIPLNQRATFRWVAAPGSELILAATANLSIIWRTTTSTAVAVTVNFLFIE